MHTVAQLAALLALATPAAGVTQMSSCDQCAGLTAEMCASAMTSAMDAMDDSSRLALYEHMFAGDICESLPSTQCLSKMTQMLSSLPTDRRVGVMEEVCEQKLLAEYSADENATTRPDGDANPKEKPKEIEAISNMTAGLVRQNLYPKPVNTCAVCTGMTSATCAVIIDRVIAEADNEAVYPVLRSLFGDREARTRCAGKSTSACADAMRDVLFEISDSSRAAIYESACAIDELAFQRMELAAAASATNLLVHECTACNGTESDTGCYDVLTAEYEAKDDRDKLEQLEQMFPGDTCDGLSDKACLKVLRSAYSELSKEAKLTNLVFFCEETDKERSETANMEEDKESKEEEVLDVDRDFNNAARLVAIAATVECTQCDDLSDTACLDVLVQQLDALSDKARLTFLKATVPTVDSLCADQSDKICLSLLDDYMTAADNATLATVLTADCATLASSSSSTTTTTSSIRSGKHSSRESLAADSDSAASATVTVSPQDNVGALSLLVVVAAAVALVVAGVKTAQAVRRRGYQKLAVAEQPESVLSL